MIHQSSYRDLREAYAASRVSPADVVASALEHAGQLDARVNAFALIDAQRALKDAHASQQRWRRGEPIGPLDGMPIAVKEFAAIEGWPTRRGSVITPPEPAATSTVFVQRLKQAGAVIIGKTRAPEFNWKGVTDSPGYGVTRNPWDTALTPGGSSGGCSAAVAGGVVRVSIGSDAGGSIRIPAAFTGTLGLKPTFGRVPVDPLPAIFSNIVHTGPIGVDAGDMAEVMAVISGATPRDPTSFLGAPLGVPEPASELRKLRVGVLSQTHWDDSADEVRAGMRAMMGALDAAGLQLSDVDVDVPEASRVGAYFYRLGCAAVVHATPPGDRRRLDAGLVQFAQELGEPSIHDHLKMCQARDAHAIRLAEAFQNVDVLLLPTVPICAFEAGRLTPAGWPSQDWMSWNPFTPAFNGAQVPALSYPVWPQGSALPVGMQFVAPRYQEHRLLGLAAMLQSDFPVRVAPNS